MKKIILTVIRVLMSPFARFYRMKLQDQISVIIYIVLMLSTAAFALWWGVVERGGTWKEVITIIVTGVIVSVLFSLFDKIGLLLPIESRISSRLQEIKDHLDLNQKNMKAELDEYSNALADTTDELQGYGNYGDARYAFGFNSIVGLSVVKDGNHNIKIRQKHFAVGIFREANVDAEICYLNSFVTHDEYYYDEIRSAAKRGANVRMLLMKPTIDCPALIARHIDYYNVVPKYKTLEGFSDALRAKYTQFRELESELAADKVGDKRVGTFKVRFYTESLNFPLITIKNGKNATDSVAYTGFYGNSEAGDMPYLEWRGGDFQIVEKFQSMFESKWTDCKSNIYPTPIDAT